jgi:hypothetical protein
MKLYTEEQVRAMLEVCIDSDLYEHILTFEDILKTQTPKLLNLPTDEQETHICKWCKAETWQSDDECYANPKNTLIEQFVIECGKYGDTAQIPNDVIEKFKEMEIAGKEMSYADGYKEGYKRVLELTKWAIENVIPPRNEQQ